MRRKEKNKTYIVRYGRRRRNCFLIDTECTVVAKWEFKEWFEGLLEKLSLFCYLFVEIESGFKPLLEML